MSIRNWFSRKRMKPAPKMEFVYEQEITSVLRCLLYDMGIADPEAIMVESGITDVPLTEETRKMAVIESDARLARVAPLMELVAVLTSAVSATLRWDEDELISHFGLVSAVLAKLVSIGIIDIALYPVGVAVDDATEASVERMLDDLGRL